MSKSLELLLKPNRLWNEHDRLTCNVLSQQVYPENEWFPLLLGSVSTLTANRDMLFMFSYPETFERILRS